MTRGRGTAGSRLLMGRKESVTRSSWGRPAFVRNGEFKLVQATLIPLARSYFPLNCEQADRQIFGLSVKSGLIIGHRNTSPFRIYFAIYFVSCFLAFQINNNYSTNILFFTVMIIKFYSPQYKVLINSPIAKDNVLYLRTRNSLN